MKPTIKFAVGVFIGIALAVAALSGSLASGVLQQILVEVRPLQYYFHGTAAETNNGMYFNGVKNVPLGFIYEGTTYVPLRFVAENLGLEVGYDGQKNIIWVGSPPGDKETGSLPVGEKKTSVSENERAVEVFFAR